MDIERMDDTQLMKEYRELRKASFDRIFGGNAKREGNKVVDELLKRGITMEPNLFGDMPIKHFKL